MTSTKEARTTQSHDLDQHGRVQRRVADISHLVCRLVKALPLLNPSQQPTLPPRSTPSLPPFSLPSPSSPLGPSVCLTRPYFFTRKTFSVFSRPYTLPSTPSIARTPSSTSPSDSRSSPSQLDSSRQSSSDGEMEPSTQKSQASGQTWSGGTESWETSQETRERSSLRGTRASESSRPFSRDAISSLLVTQSQTEASCSPGESALRPVWVSRQRN